MLKTWRWVEKAWIEQQQSSKAKEKLAFNYPSRALAVPATQKEGGKNLKLVIFDEKTLSTKSFSSEKVKKKLKAIEKKAEVLWNS